MAMGQFVIVGIFLVGMCAFVWTLIAQEAAGGAGFGRPSRRRSLAARWDPLDLVRRLRRRIGTLDLLTRALAVGTKRETMEESEKMFIAAKEASAEQVREIDGLVQFEWIEGIHDVPLQRPDAVADLIRRFATETSGGS